MFACPRSSRSSRDEYSETFLADRRRDLMWMIYSNAAAACRVARRMGRPNAERDENCTVSRPVREAERKVRWSMPNSLASWSSESGSVSLACSVRLTR